MLEVEYELNRKWILDEETGEPIGETNFVVPGDWLAELFNEEFSDRYSDFENFLGTYVPETEGEYIRQKALEDDVLCFDGSIEEYLEVDDLESEPDDYLEWQDLIEDLIEDDDLVWSDPIEDDE